MPNRISDFRERMSSLVTPQFLHIIIFRIFARGAACAATRHNDRLLTIYAADKAAKSLIIKINIGKGCKQSVDDDLICILCFGIAGAGTGQSDQRPCQLILQSRRTCGFTADARITCTAGTPCCLFTLKTKHF